jgi:hypothetical protein
MGHSVSDDAKQIPQDFRRSTVPLKPQRPLRWWHLWGEFDPYKNRYRPVLRWGGLIIPLWLWRTQ